MANGHNRALNKAADEAKSQDVRDAMWAPAVPSAVGRDCRGSASRDRAGRVFLSSGAAARGLV
jgi:hypothetical protein